MVYFMVAGTEEEWQVARTIRERIYPVPPPVPPGVPMVSVTRIDEGIQIGETLVNVVHSRALFVQARLLVSVPTNVSVRYNEQL
jgi:hypothetical protein